MKQETKICQNCKQGFAIEPDDFQFYEKMQVPPPTFCPDCRAQRRFAWRNERTLYKRTCSLCNKSIIGLYPAGTPFPVYCRECWYSDKWDPLSYGTDFDETEPFFEQLKRLIRQVPRLAIWVTQCQNSEYTNQSYSNKNAYLSFAVRDSEDVAYVTRAVELKNCLDATYTHHSEYLYQCINTDKSYQSAFLEESEGIVESSFLSSCRNCQQCLGAVNARSASHIYFGEQLTKEQYAERLAAVDIGSRAAERRLRDDFAKLRAGAIFRFAKLTNCVNSVGDHLNNTKNCHYVFDGFDLENARHSSWVFTSKEFSDCYGMGGSEFVYEGIGVEEVNNLKFCNVVDGSNHIQYADLCAGSSNLFGCVGLRSKQYCILNKQYVKEEYEVLLPKIIEQMNRVPYANKAGQVYRYGEFFPPELSPFCYNETVAQEQFPLTKEQALARGYRWRDPEERHYAVTLPPDQVPDRIQNVPDSIVEQVIGCVHKGMCVEQCTTAFKIIPNELQFYRQMKLPLPDLCPNCRHYERLAQRNPLKLWHRACECEGRTSRAKGHGEYRNTGTHQHGTGKCLNEFETSYAPGRPEIVYCESCYQQEVA